MDLFLWGFEQCLWRWWWNMQASLLPVWPLYALSGEHVLGIRGGHRSQFVAVGEYPLFGGTLVTSVDPGPLFPRHSLCTGPWDAWHSASPYGAPTQPALTSPQVSAWPLGTQSATSCISSPGRILLSCSLSLLGTTPPNPAPAKNKNKNKRTTSLLPLVFWNDAAGAPSKARL